MLLAILAPVLLLGSGLALTGFDTGTPSHRREAERTRAALAQAKEVLIHYAVADANRPGELPCPDFDGDGRLLLNADFFGGRDVPCASRRGWLPFRSLGVGELRDGTGERLWYAVADTHHAGHSAPLNSDVPGELRVGGMDDIVAVIIAPGFPVDQRQARDRDAAPSGSSATALLSAHLEDANAGTDRDRFAPATRPSREVNDRLMPIARRELARVVERRVIGEVSRTLSVFYREHGTLPWLVPLADPDAASIRAVPGIRKGRLAYQRVGDRVESRVLRARWALIGARTTAWGSVGHALLVAGNLRFDQGPGPSGTPECLFSRSEEAECVARKTVSVVCAGIPFTPAERTYRFRLTGDAVVVSAPDATRVRRRQVSANRADAPGPIRAGHRVEIRIEDRALSGFGGGVPCGAGSVRDATAAWGFMEVGEIDHPLVLDSELPAWFIDEGWSALTYVAFAAPRAPSDAPRPCVPEVDCLVLEGVHPAADKDALVVIAGAALPGRGRDTWDIEAYFEGENATLDDDVFSVLGPPGEMNDQIRIVSLAP